VELLGYADRRSCRVGDVVSVMVSTDFPLVEAELVRLVDGSPNPPSEDAPAERLRPPLVVRAEGKVQRSPVGSRADLPLPAGWDADGSAIIRCWVYPTTPGVAAGDDETVANDNVRMAGRLMPVERRRQVVWALGQRGANATLAVVLLPDGRVGVEAGGAVIAEGRKAVRSHTWYGILVSVREDAVTLDISSAIGRWYTTDHA
jgi:N,N-dimethylformamidase